MQSLDKYISRNGSRDQRRAGAQSGARLARLDAGCVAAVFPIAGGPLTIGRDAGNEIFLGDTLASKRHAAVSFQGRRLIVEDLNSLNGTLVNERRVKAQGLAPGDVIRIGRSLYIYLTDGMPLKRSSARAAGWLIGRSPAGGLKLPATETPILIGRAPEADVRVAEHGICDFQVQVAGVPGGVQVIQLAADPPRCFVLADGAELKVGGTVLLYRAGTASPASKAAHRAPARPVARPAPAPSAKADPPPQSEPPEMNLIRLLEAESQRIDRDEPRDATARLAWKCRITARNGPLAGKTFMFLGKRIIIGRDKKSKIHLDDEDVSRSHACIWRREGDVVITDLKSGNGVFVNGAAVRRAPLKPGDVVRIGSTEFLVHL
jgi:pSer/pThr/pTyr-binding forkhead associated (FHA) protein